MRPLFILNVAALSPQEIGEDTPHLLHLAERGSLRPLEAPEPAVYKVEVIFKEEYPAGQATITAGKVRQQLDLVAKKKRGHTTMMMMPAGKFKLSVDAVFNGKIQGPHQVILKVQ